MKLWATIIAVAMAVALAAGVAACFSRVAVHPPPGEHPEVTRGRFPHEVLDQVLASVVDDRGRVDYLTLAANRRDLERYLAAVADVSPHSRPELFPTREDALAYWINAYNAYVLYAVTERPSMKAVDDDKTDFFYFTKYDLGDETMSLYELENEVVREEFADPRIHFALNCASLGCSELPAEAFTPARLEEQLHREAREFCADPKKVKVIDDDVEMSKIFEWYADDFEAAGGPLELCRAYGRDDLPAKEEAGVSFMPFDWTLNSQPNKSLSD